MYRHHPLTHAVQAIVDSGRLGAIQTYQGGVHLSC